MNRMTAATGAGIAVLSLSLVLSGCGSDDKTATSSSAASSSAATSDTSASPASPTPEAGPKKTILDYVKENNIQEVAVQRGDPGPNINVPLPEGWQPIQGNLPKGTYAGIVYTKSAVPNNPPRILAMLSKLTGNVDPAEVLKYAPGELNNLPGYTGNTTGDPSKLAGFDAIQLGGTFADGDKKGMIVQKTVVIPADKAVYVLQFNGLADESEAPILGEATKVIDDKITIKN